MGYNTNRSEDFVSRSSTTEVRCPYCGSTETNLLSLFGQQLLTVQYYCHTCHTPFEYIKDDEVLDDCVARKENQL